MAQEEIYAWPECFYFNIYLYLILRVEVIIIVYIL